MPKYCNDGNFYLLPSLLNQKFDTRAEESNRRKVDEQTIKKPKRYMDTEERSSDSFNDH